MENIRKIKSELQSLKNPDKISSYSGFHKTGKGGYAEKDIFLGISVPQLRGLAIRCKQAKLKSIKLMLSSKIHEERYLALLILVSKYKSGTWQEKEQITGFYIKNAKRCNGWDLVDASAPYILGDFLLKNNTGEILYNLSRSDNLWEKRISIVSTYTFIKDNKFENTVNIAKNLLKEKHDLIQKAVGWMLREVGNRDKKVLEKFLNQNLKSMPRTMLRYAIEKLPENQRKAYLKGNI